MKKILLSIALVFSFSIQAQIINTIAGNGLSYSTNPNSSPFTMLGDPSSIVMDSSGNLYISDNNNHIIRKITSAGVMSIIAGQNFVSGYSGDGGLAVNAKLNGPDQITIDASGNLYIADANNHVIRKINSSGIITTIAGNYNLGGGYSGDGAPSTSAALNYPNGVCVDLTGNIYISDSGNGVIRKVNTSGIISTYAGNFANNETFMGDGGPAIAAGFYGPEYLFIDAPGNLFIADAGNNVIRKVSTTGIITTIAGNNSIGGSYSGDGGLATNAGLSTPYAVKADALGNLYILDSDNNRVRMVNTSGIITTIAGTGTANYSGDGGQATLAELSYPSDLVFDASGNMFIADDGNKMIRKINTSGVINIYAGSTQNDSGDGGLATGVNLSFPTAICTDNAGNYYIVDGGHYVIRKINAAGIITTIAGNNIQGYSGDGGLAINASIDDILGIAIDANGNIYFSQKNTHVIRKIDVAGIITTIAGTGVSGYNGDGGLASAAKLWQPRGITFDASGNLYFADVVNNRVRKIDGSGIISTVVGGSGGGYTGDGGLATSALLYLPVAVAIDITGNLYISDFNNHVVRMVNTSGIITTVAGNHTAGYTGDGGLATAAQINLPHGITVDANGNIFVTQGIDNVVRMIDAASGNISTVAGNGIAGFSGDGGLATAAQLSSNYTTGIALDISGNLYITDPYNDRIRFVCNAAITSPSISTSSSSLCNGDSTVLTGNGNVNYNYSWLPVIGLSSTTSLSTTANPTATTVYTLTASKVGCLSTAQQTITVNPLPIISATTNNTLLCTGQTATLSVTGASTYTWSTTENTTNIAVSPTIQTTYTVGGIDANGCSNTTTIMQDVSLCTGILVAEALEATLKVYPNPNNGLFNVELTTASQVTVINALGEVIIAETMVAGIHNLNIQNQSSGVYFVKIIQQDKQHIIKLIKE